MDDNGNAWRRAPSPCESRNMNRACLRRSLSVLLLLIALLSASQCLAAEGQEPIDYEPLKTRFAAVVEAELADGITPGFSVAWIADAMLVHADGYGLADWEAKKPATAETIYRAGSISKLLNAIAVMQQVEQGKLDLDAPIQQALPGFSIVNPFANAAPITLRQMLSHRSGMIREAPVGGYLDPSQPSIQDTLASVSGAVLVNPPNRVMRYSNVGPTIAGEAVVKASGLAYPEYQQKNLLEPLGMKHSTWLMTDSLRPQLAKGRMRIAKPDGEYTFDVAPEFELGTLPAGNLYTTANDLAQFAIFMLGSDASAELTPPLVHPATFETMCYPQLIDDNTGFGLGFYVGEYRGRKTLQHGGAVYGFSTVIIAIPEERIAVLVLSNADIASAPVRRLADASLDLLFEKLKGEAPAQPPQVVELSSEQLASLAGEYESESYWASLKVDGDKLVGTLSGQPLTFRATGPHKLLARGRMMNDAPFEFEALADGAIQGFTAAGQEFTRVAAETPPIPAAWKELVGAYGPEFIPLVVSVRNGHLYGAIENEYEYRLKPIDRVTFALPPGMYTDEQLIFQIDAAGKPIGAILANQYLSRRAD